MALTPRAEIAAGSAAPGAARRAVDRPRPRRLRPAHRRAQLRDRGARLPGDADLAAAGGGDRARGAPGDAGDRPQRPARQRLAARDRRARSGARRGRRRRARHSPHGSLHRGLRLRGRARDTRPSTGADAGAVRAHAAPAHHARRRRAPHLDRRGAREARAAASRRGARAPLHGGAAGRRAHRSLADRAEHADPLLRGAGAAAGAGAAHPAADLSRGGLLARAVRRRSRAPLAARAARAHDARRSASAGAPRCGRYIENGSTRVEESSAPKRARRR